MKDWAEITKTLRLDMFERVVFPAIGKLPVREITPHHIFKILQEPLNEERQQLPLKPVAPFHQFLSWQSRRLELIAIPYGLCARPFRLIRHSTNRH